MSLVPVFLIAAFVMLIAGVTLLFIIKHLWSGRP